MRMGVHTIDLAGLSPSTWQELTVMGSSRRYDLVECFSRPSSMLQCMPVLLGVH